MAAAGDAAYFIHAYLTIDDSQGIGEGEGTMPFRLWPAQVGVVFAIQTSRLAIILKARQLGISWICCGFELWKCMFQPGQVVLLFSKGQDEADELLRRVAVLYARLPEWLRQRCPLVRPPNKSEIEWKNGSRIKSLPATKHAGSGWTASSVVMDEAAKIQFADDLYAALKPTIDGGGQLIVVSTAFGIGNKFHALWTKSATGENGFKAIFLPWWARPGRDRRWYENQVAEETDPGRVKENYPRTASEAFRVSGRPRFDPSWIERQADNVWDAGLPAAALPESLRPVPDLIVYELPVRGRRYLIGADVAKGLEHGDYSDAVVIDAETWVEMASLHGHWEPDEFGGYLKTLSEAYDDALIVPERNNHGHAVIATLKLLGCYSIHKGQHDQYGWDTNLQTKPQMIDILAEALRDDLVTIRTRAALDEMQIYRIEPNGNTSAPDGYHDDRVMSRAIALAVARRPVGDHGLGAAVPVPFEHRPVHRPRVTDDWNRRDPGQMPQPSGQSGQSRAVDFGVQRERRSFYGR